MALIADNVLDDGLQALTDDTTSLFICSQEPTTYTEAITTYALGTKSTPTVGAPAAGSPNGRQVTVSAITDGSVTGTGTATHWALVGSVGSVLLAANSLSSSQSVTSGNTFTLAAFTVRIPDPA